MHITLTKHLRTVALCLMASGLVGCVTPAQQPQRDGRFGANLPFLPTTNADLGIYLARVKKGEPFYDIYLLGWEKNDAINPNIKPRAFQDTEEMLNNCRPGGGLGDIRVTQEDTFFDRSAYDGLMRSGQEIAKMRHVWQFHMDRAQAQKRVLEGLGRRTGASFPSNTTDGSGSSRSQEGGVSPRQAKRPEAAQRAPLPVPQVQRTPPPQARNHSAAEVEQAIKALDYNFQILGSMDTEIRRREDVYLADLSKIYEEALTKMKKHLSLSTFDLLDRYEILREQNIMLCGMRVTNNSSPGKLRLVELNKQSRDVVVSFLKASKPKIVADMDRQRLLADKQKVYASYFKTVSLQKLAASELGIQAPDGIAKRAPGETERLTLD